MRNLILLGILLIGLLLAVSTCKEILATSIENIQLTPANFTSIRGEVNSSSINNVLNKIYQSDPKERFYIFLDSPGGEVFSGLRLVRVLLSTDRKITCVATTAISMAFVILQACPTRVVTESSALMSHEVAITAERQNVLESKNILKILQGLEDNVEMMIAKRLKITVEEYQSRIQPEYWLIGGSVILRDKAADRIVTVTCSTETERTEETYEITTVFGITTAKRPFCPL